MLFEEAYEEYKIYAQKRHKKQSFDCFVYNFNANILSYFKGFKLLDISYSDLLSWEDFIYNKCFSNSHNKNLYAMIKQFFKYCSLHFDFNCSFIDDLPVFKLKVEEKKTDFYTLKEFNKFIKCVDNEVYKQFFTFMFYVGTRPGECMALKFSDIKNDSVYINKTIDSHHDREVGTPKTLSSNRFVKIDKKLLNDLYFLRDFYISKYGNETFDYYIFGGIKPLAPTTINRYKLKACEKADIRPITLHQFRHSHATLLFQNGIDIHVIKDRLGHSKVSTTLDVYTHNNLIQEKRVMKTLNLMRFNIFDCFVYYFKNIISILKRN